MTPHIVLANKHFLGLSGGAERNICDLANWLAENGYRVTILSETKYGTAPKFFVHESVDIVAPREDLKRNGEDRTASRFRYGAEGTAWLHGSRTLRQKWRACIEELKPDAIVTFMPHTSTFLLEELGDEFPILVTNQNDPRIDYFSDKHGADPFERKLRLESLERAKFVHFLVPGFVNSMPENVQSKAVVIPNVVVPRTSLRSSLRPCSNKVIGIGRLVPQKGFDLLIKEFRQVVSCHPDWELHIFGEGEERRVLEAMIRRLKLQPSVFLRGHSDNPIAEMESADIFVIPSVYEGWGLTLTEAMSVGLPTIGFDDCSGVNWLIKHNCNGLLVERSPSSLAGAIGHLIADSEVRIRLGQQATAFVKQFSPERIYPIWAQVIDSMIGNPK